MWAITYSHANLNLLQTAGFMLELLIVIVICRSHLVKHFTNARNSRIVTQSI